MSDLLFGRFHDRLKGFSRENLGEGMVFIAGPTCAGKNAIIDGIIAASDGCARRCISATTRKPRDYEVHGEHYLFMSESEFKDAIASGQLLEYVRQGEDFYGKLLAPIEENQAAGIISLIEMEVEGIKNVKDRFPNALRIFIFAPMFILKERIRRCGDRNDVERRLVQATTEIAKARIPEYFSFPDEWLRSISIIAADGTEKPDGLVQTTHAAMERIRLMYDAWFPEVFSGSQNLDRVYA